MIHNKYTLMAALTLIQMSLVKGSVINYLMLCICLLFLHFYCPRNFKNASHIHVPFCKNIVYLSRKFSSGDVCSQSIKQVSTKVKYCFKTQWQTKSLQLVTVLKAFAFSDLYPLKRERLLFTVAPLEPLECPLTLSRGRISE